MNNLKNPLVLGALGIAVTYGYLWYTRNNEVETTRQKLNSAFSQGMINQEQLNQQLDLKKKESISLMYPIIVVVALWLIASYMVSKNAAATRAGGSGSTSSKLVGNISDSVSVDVVKPKNSQLWR